MKRIIFMTGLVLTLVFASGEAMPMAHKMMARSGEASEGSKLLGTTVKNPQGEDLGIITGIVAGPEGRVAFAVLSYQVSDDTQRRVAVPFGALSCEDRGCVLNARKETLESAPMFVLEEYLAELNVAEEIYRYFGVQPYWTEEETPQ